MSKTLKTIQTISKVCKIIAMIVFVFSIIGAILSALGLALFLAVKDVAIGDMTVTGFLADEGISFADSIFAMIVAVISCIGSAVVAKFAHIYFTNELEAGTPFTYDGAKEMLRLGILALAIPIGISSVSSIAFVTYKMFDQSLTTADYNISVDIGIGLALIFMSFIFKYGAEREEKRASEESQEYDL